MISPHQSHQSYSINGYVCLVCCVFDSMCEYCVVKEFAICLGVVAILLLNVIKVFSVGGGVLLLDKPCMVFQRMCGWGL